MHASGTSPSVQPSHVLPPRAVGPAGSQATPPLDLPVQPFVTSPTCTVFYLTAEGRILYVNRQAATTYIAAEAKPSELVGRDIKDFLPEPWVRERLGWFRRVLESGKPLLARCIWRGEQRLAWINAGPVTPDRLSTIVMIIQPVHGHAVREGLDVPQDSYVESEFIDLGPLSVLSRRELEVLALLGLGYPIKGIAAELNCSVKTCEKHRAALGAKLRAPSRAALVALALRAGLSLADALRARPRKR